MTNKNKRRNVSFESMPQEQFSVIAIHDDFEHFRIVFESLKTQERYRINFDCPLCIHITNKGMALEEVKSEASEGGISMFLVSDDTSLLRDFMEENIDVYDAAKHFTINLREFEIDVVSQNIPEVFRI